MCKNFDKKILKMKKKIKGEGVVVDLAHLQAFKLKCSVGSSTFNEQVKNAAIARQTGLPHIAYLIASGKYSLYSNVVPLTSDTPYNMAFKMCKMCQ